MTDNAKRSACGLLGIAKKAGKVVCGCDRISDELKKGCIRLVITASDASDNTLKRMNDHCGYYKIDILHCSLTQGELGKCIGETGNIAAVAITDKGFKESLAKLLSD